MFEVPCLVNSRVRSVLMVWFGRIFVYDLVNVLFVLIFLV